MSLNNICDYGKYAKHFTTKVNLGTNGSLISTLSSTQIKDIKEIFNEISISLDTLDGDLFEKITCNRLERTLEGIEIFRKNGLKIKICMVITNLNKDLKNIKNLISYCKRNKIEKLRLYWFVPRENTNILLRPSECDYKNLEFFIKNLVTSVDVKLRRYYTPKEYMVISSKGNIKTFTDEERINPINLGNENEFIKNYEKLKY